MEESSDKPPPTIIKLCPSSNQEADISSSETIKDNKPLASPNTKPTSFIRRPTYRLCHLSKDGILTEAITENLKKSPTSVKNLQLKPVFRERIISLRCQNTMVDSKLDHTNEAERQSLTSHSSMLTENRLDTVHGGDKSQSLLFQPPLTMQPSNLHTDQLLDAKYGGGGSEPSVVQESSTLSAVVKKPLVVEEDDMEPARKKIKLLGANLVDPECLSLICDKFENKSTKKTKIIQLRSPPTQKSACAESSISVLEKGSLVQSFISSSCEKEISLSVKSDVAKLTEKEISAAAKTEHPQFKTVQSSNSTDLNSKNEDMEICSLVESENLDNNTVLNKGDINAIAEIDLNVGEIEIKNMQIDANLKHVECSLLTSGDEMATYLKEEKNKDEIVSSDKVLKKDKNEDNLAITKEFSVNSDHVDNNKKVGDSYNQAKKVCPFKHSLEDRFGQNSNKISRTEILENKESTTEQNVKDETIVKTDMEGDVADSKELLMMDSSRCKIDNAHTVLEDKSKIDSPSESNVNHSQIEDEFMNFKEKEFSEQHENFSEDEGNELLGISSDESNQLESQNGTQEAEMEFDILDEFESNDNDPDTELRSSDSESGISADEIDAMLEAGLGDYGKPNVQNEHEVKEKVILKARGKDHFEVLPEGWIEVTHNSGVPIYLHKQTRVCCVSKPYFLGPGSTRKHEIPISAIPCLQYQKELEKEKLEAENKLNGVSELLDEENSSNKNDSSAVNGNGIEDTSKIKSDLLGKNSIAPNASKGSNLIFPSAKLESVKDVKVSGSLDYLAVREYCQKRFEFQTITVKRFKTWCGRRKHQKQMRRKQRPFLPDNTQLITCPLPSNTDKSTTVGSTSKREFIMNPTGKSPVCILHEYVQHTLRVQPKYIFKELESASTPYGAVVIINEMEYGTGYGSSKKVAKSEAAKSALEVLIPKIKKIDPEKRSDEDEYQDVEFFDQVRVEDPRISDLSVKAGQPFPYQILLECLKRNYGMGDTEVSIIMKNLKHQKNEFIMKVGKHTATVVCKNKRDGKHRASQAILQQLHPHINSWGSLLRMYGKGSCKTLKEKKEEEQRITELQSKACVNKPNISILNKLKEEMMKYSEKMKSKKPIGKLIPERMQLFSISDSNLKSIEL